MASAKAQVNISVETSYTGTNGIANYSGNPSIAFQQVFSSSTVTKVFSAVGTISTVTAFDVTSLTDAFGNALSFGTVKGCCVNNTHLSSSLTVGGGSDPLFGTDQYTVKAGTCLTITSPFTSSGSAKNISITPSASCTYQILIFG